MGDVILRQTQNDGDICVTGGLVAMDGGLSTAAYLSLFGGNFSDDGSQDNPSTWWGNQTRNRPGVPVPQPDAEPSAGHTGNLV